MRYEARQLYLMDEMARINAAQAQGVTQGIIQGRAEGRAEGIAEGKAEGIVEGKVETARNLLKIGLDIDQIIVATGLSVDEIRKL